MTGEPVDTISRTPDQSVRFRVLRSTDQITGVIQKQAIHTLETVGAQAKAAGQTSIQEACMVVESIMPLIQDDTIIEFKSMLTSFFDRAYRNTPAWNTPNELPQEKQIQGVLFLAVSNVFNRGDQLLERSVSQSRLTGRELLGKIVEGG